MSEPTPLDDLLKVAVVGLQNSGDFRHLLPPEIAALVAAQSYDNEAQAFLDAAALAWLQAELSRVPAPDTYDELPDIAAETGRVLTAEQSLSVQRLLSHDHLVLVTSALRLLQRYGCVLPDLLFCDVLEQEKFERSAAWVLVAVASARSQWLLGMNSRWQRLLARGAEAKEFAAMGGSEQLWHLAKMPAAAVGDFCRQQWQACNASGRRVLLSYLRSFPGGEFSAWLAEQLNDKSAVVKREIVRCFIACAHPQAAALRDKAKAQLAIYLDVTQPLKPDLKVPETLDSALAELAVLDQDYLASQLPKPVQRLGQLLVLSGPEAWGQSLHCDSATAMARLLQTRFAAELEPYLLEAALYHRDTAALGSWCQNVSLNEGSRLPEYLSVILRQLGPQCAVYCVENILQHRQVGLLLSSKIWRLMTDFCRPLALDSAQNFFQQWCSHIVQQRYAFDREVACTLPLWLDLDLSQGGQRQCWQRVRDKKKFPPQNLDSFEALLQLKASLQRGGT